MRLCGEVMPMDVKARILAVRLAERIRKDPAYARSLGIEAALRRKGRVSEGPQLRTKGLTKL